MRVSVILSTYNQPVWLEKVLWGYSVQSNRLFEVVVADDGSTEETAEMLARVGDATGLDIRHVWHEDRGFRKCRILNQAIVESTGEYLIFSDGDCIPSQDFVATHLEFAAPERFLSGGIVRLPMSLSKRITIDDVVEQRATSLRWLTEHGLKWNKQCLLLAGGSLGATFDLITPTKATWNGHNASGWKSDLLEVNGFDERMGYGGEDRELGERLVNLGIRPFQIRHRAACVHLDHSRGYVDPGVLEWNRQHRQYIRSEGITWTEHGVVQQPAEVIKFPQREAEEKRRAA